MTSIIAAAVAAVSFAGMAGATTMDLPQDGPEAVESPVQAENPAKTASFTPLTDTNLQLFYDFGEDRRFVTATLEMFHADAWGNTFFFADFDFNFRDDNGRNIGPSGAYLELSRCLNFWQKSPLGGLSLQVEYNGGLGAYKGGGYPINHALLVGANYFLHSKDFRYTFNLQLLYKKYLGMKQVLPMQFTFVWGCQDIFKARGLRFCGYVDVWNEHDKCVVGAEPQLWYSVGQWFGCPNLNIGTEVELSYNFAGVSGFRCRPCLGAKWVF